MWSAALLLLGVLACSTSVIFIKQSALDPAILSGLRLLLAAGLLGPLFVRARRRQPTWRWADLKSSAWPALVLALHFVSWVVGARATLAANASLIVNMVPVAMPFFLVPLAGERLRGSDLAGSALAIAGVATLSASEARLARAHLGGDLICFGSMLLFALYLTLGRRNRHVPSIWLYVVPLYLGAGALCLCFGALRGGLGPISAEEWGYALALAVVPTVIGHSLLNYSLTRLPGATVSVCNLAQFLFAAGLGWLLFGEVPKLAFWPASALILSGALTALRGAAAGEPVRALGR